LPVIPAKAEIQDLFLHRERAKSLDSRFRGKDGVSIVNRIDLRFAELKAVQRCGLIPFITAGDPSPESTVAIMHALVDAGADVLEIGVPFSDPMADGPVIQHASERALARGVGLTQVLGYVRDFRSADATTPIVLMGYLNPIEIYGYERFARDASAAGVDGTLIVDCPLEETSAVDALRAAGLSQILLAAPTTDDRRLALMRERAEGFLYYVSFAGITGANRLSIDAVRTRVQRMKTASRVPVAVGFGVRDASSAAAIGEFADAVVIGSALVERLATAAATQAAVEIAREFLAPIRAALDTKKSAHAA
jgi:tryptophan synthase alpha chain